MSDNERGFYQKYIVQKASGNPVDPEARYFVLRVDEDPAARAALRTYAYATPNNALCADLLKWLLWLGDLPDEEFSSLRARLKAGERLAKLARRLEWHDSIMDPHDGPVGCKCPVCGQESRLGHAEDCELAAALADYDKAVVPDA